MPDMEKVRVGIFEMLQRNTWKDIDKERHRFQSVLNDALALLKEQEPIEPVDDGHGSLICGNQGYECGCVGRYDLTTKVVEKYCNFCPECGRKVKWNECNDL
jgi:hypothetical protein